MIEALSLRRALPVAALAGGAEAENRRCLVVGTGHAFPHGETEDQRAKNRADDAWQIELRALDVRQPIPNHAPNEAAEGARQERRAMGRARPTLQRASARN